MRSILESPVDPERLNLLSRLVERVYALHETAHSYENELVELGALAGSAVTPFQIDCAFGSASPRSFAHDLLVRSVVIPSDISRAEMLEMLQHLLQPKRGELRHGYWLACLARSTGDQRISDLIYWPGEYFKDGDNSRDMSAEAILRVAEASGRSEN